MSQILFSLRRLFGRGTAEDALDDEIRFHLEKSIEQKIAQGMSPQEARQSALKDFGGVEQFKEQTREAWGLRLFFDTIRDARFACRQIGRHKGYAAVIVLTLALCLGMNTAAFSLLRNVVLHPYLYSGQEDLKLIGLTEQSDGTEAVYQVSVPQYVFFQEHAQSFSALGMVDPGDTLDLEIGSGVERISLDMVTPGVWEALGVAPLEGRVFSEADLAENNDRVVVLAYPLYRRMKSAGRTVIGEDILLDGEAYRVIGAMPKGFYMGFQHAGAWVPRILRPDESMGDHSFSIIGRVGEGISDGQVELEMAQLRREFLERYPDYRVGWDREQTNFGMIPIDKMLRQGMPMISVAFYSVQLVTVLVLLIGCLNISGMIMVRSSARMREFCMRRALGASKVRLARQLLTEIILLFILGGAVSLLVVRVAYTGFSALNLDQIPWGQQHEIDFGILAGTFGVTLVAAIFTGGLPLFAILRGRLHQMIQADGRTQSGSRGKHRLHTTFVVGQVAGSLILLILAGVSAGNLHGVLQRSPGFEREGRMGITVAHPDYRFGSGEAAYRDRILPIRQRILEALEKEPGVISASTSNRIPSSPYRQGHSDFSFLHYQFSDAESRPNALRMNISPGYFDTIGTRLLLGRDFRASDDWEAEKVVIVNRGVIDRYFEGLDPIGMKLRFWGEELTIVGVAEEVRDKPYFMDEVDYNVYLPISQWTMANNETIFLVHVSGNADDFRERLTKRILAVDPQASIGIETFDETYKIATFTYQLPMVLTLVFAGLALLLTALGLYGLISYTVAERTKEFGIRMALGAPVSSIGKIVAHSSATRVGFGMVIGLSVSYALCYYIKPLISDFNATSLPLFFGAFLFVAFVAVVASFLPTWRATRIDPASALRYQ